MMRYAFHLTIRHGMEDEYDRRHASVWEDMRKMLRDSGISNYSIYRDGIHVFGYWECDDLGKTLEDVNSSDVNTRWQKYMNDVILTPKSERTSAGMREIFRLD
jgi:L-rhamnose mutarotase